MAASATCVLVLGAAPPAPAIYDGERAAFADFEFMVSVRSLDRPQRHVCGGTLIAPDLVLSAAHCLVGVNPKRLTAVVGADKPDWKKAPRVRVTGFRVPGSYSFESNRGDVALLRLASSQTSPTVGLVEAEPEVAGSVLTAGWGCTDRPLQPQRCRRHAPHLQAAEQQVVADSQCDRSTFWNPPAHARTSICAMGSDAVANLGDSGGPLLVGDAATGYAQVGVVSLLSDKPRAPLNAHTSVPALRGWIDRATVALRARG